MNSNKSDFQDLVNLFNFFWLKKKKLFLITFTIIVLGTVYAFLATNWYEANVKIIPSISEAPTIPQQYASLAAIAGINILSSSEEKMMLYPEIIQSNFVLNKLIKHKFNTGITDSKTTLYDFFKVNIDTTNITIGSPSYKELEKLKKKIRDEILKTNYDLESGILTIKVQFPKNPIIATEIANFIIVLLDDYNKNHRKYKATEQIQFIEKSIQENMINLEKAEKTFEEYQMQNKDLSSPKNLLEYERLRTELEVQRSLYIELRKQLEITKIEKIKETETLNVLEEATVPYKKFKPRRLNILIISCVLGFILSTIYVILESKWTKITFFLGNSSSSSK